MFRHDRIKKCYDDSNEDVISEQEDDSDVIETRGACENNTRVLNESLRFKLREIRDRNNDLSNRNNDLNCDVEKITFEAERCKKNVDQLQWQNKTLKSNFNSIEIEKVKLLEEQAEKNNKLNCQLTKYAGIMDEHNNKIVSLKNKNKSLACELSVTMRESEDLKEENNKYKEQLTCLKLRLNKTEQVLAEREAGLIKESNDTRSLKIDLQASLQKAQRSEQKYKESNNVVEEMKIDLIRLKNKFKEKVFQLKEEHEIVLRKLTNENKGLISSIRKLEHCKKLQSTEEEKIKISNLHMKLACKTERIKKQECVIKELNARCMNVKPGCTKRQHKSVPKKCKLQLNDSKCDDETDVTLLRKTLQKALQENSYYENMISNLESDISELKCKNNNLLSNDTEMYEPIKMNCGNFDELSFKIQKEKLNNIICELRKDMENTKKDLNTSEKALCQALEAVNNLKTENCEKSQSLRELVATNTNLKKLSQKLGANELILNEDIRNKNEEIINLEKENKAIIKIKEQRECQLKQNIELMKCEIEERNDKIQSMDENKSRVEKDLHQKDNIIHRLEMKLSDHKVQLQTSSEDHEQEKKTLKMEQLQLEKMNTRRDERIDSLEEEKNEANQIVRELTEEINDVKQKFKKEITKVENEKKIFLQKLDCQDRRFNQKNQELFKEMEDVSKIRQKQDEEMRDREVGFSKQIKEYVTEISEQKRKLGKLKEQLDEERLNNENSAIMLKNEKCIQNENKTNIRNLNTVICEKDIEIHDIMDSMNALHNEIRIKTCNIDEDQNTIAKLKNNECELKNQLKSLTQEITKIEQNNDCLKCQNIKKDKELCSQTRQNLKLKDEIDSLRCNIKNEKSRSPCRNKMNVKIDDINISKDGNDFISGKYDLMNDKACKDDMSAINQLDNSFLTRNLNMTYTKTENNVGIKEEFLNKLVKLIDYDPYLKKNEISLLIDDYQANKINTKCKYKEEFIRKLKYLLDDCPYTNLNAIKKIICKHRNIITCKKTKNYNRAQSYVSDGLCSTKLEFSPSSTFMCESGISKVNCRPKTPRTSSPRKTCESVLTQSVKIDCKSRIQRNTKKNIRNKYRNCVSPNYLTSDESILINNESHNGTYLSDCSWKKKCNALKGFGDISVIHNDTLSDRRNVTLQSEFDMD